ncbi:MAG: D-alanyl-D-alanine carboxypeptidase [Oscillospiraceae bacterium]|nr:D-alanyl-D-alanine carboxypeptidase [Oscillospiraceae bacterium]
MPTIILNSISSAAFAVAAPPRESAYCAVLYNPADGTTLYADSADNQRPIASVTKIMTALIVVERCKLNDTMTFKREWLCEGSSSGFQPGKEYTVRQMLYALLLASGNDAAIGLAEFTAGSVDAFSDLMNAKAEQLNLGDSHFANPNGLDDDNHYSSALDMAKLTAYALKNMKFALIASTQEARVGGIYFKNHNKLLWQYEYAVGVKTGYTSKAGRTLVSAAQKNGATLICVTLNDPNDWDDHAALYDWGFQQLSANAPR